MTSKLTRERLQEIAEEGFLKHGESKELARMALGAMDSEPVAWTWHYREQWHVTNDKCRAEFVAKDGDVAVLPLYRHAQPAPVVPDEMTIRDACKFVQDMRLFDDVSVIVMRTWNACRAAMLHAGNSPAQSDCCPAQNHVSPEQNGDAPAQSQGWIPVSERMPETDGNYWGWWSESKRQGPVWFIKSELQAQFQSSEITHWMPLPAAPQEVK
ncbi:TPA: DUF551 domain-containing protein [Klebsiella variicola subsp. variicola]|nr:DUF551 domain-containing protein [Klebsiella variicola subsp. variicola]